MQLLPGGGVVKKAVKISKSPFKAVGSLFGGDAPEAPPPLPPPPTREDPAIDAARKKQQAAAKNRKGRRATILTSGQGVEDKLGVVNRPQARSSNLLGG